MINRYGIIPFSEFREFVRIVRRLRKECPWDRKQSHRSLRDSLIEETYEVVEAIDRKNPAHLKGELGDLLLNIALQATIAEQAGEFTFREVLSEISAKLVRRHPHVFGSARAATAEDVKRTWETVKRAEGRQSVLEGIPGHLPALQRAHKMQQRASKVGFDWERADDAWEKVKEEVDELRASILQASQRKREEEFGDLLFALVNYARFIGVNPEHALRATNQKFMRRFHYIEKVLRKRGKEPHESTLAEMDTLWNQAKRRKRRTLLP
jgi:MazG family protein